MANGSAKNRGSSGARRLGPQQPPAKRSSGAQRRQARAQAQRSKRFGWIAVGVVVVVVLALIIVKVTSSSSTANNTSSTSSGITTGDDPALAPAAMVDPVTSVPLAAFNAVGIDKQPAAMVVTKNQPVLTLDSKPRFVYVGAEYCPYSAAMRWSLVAALSRFGSFSGLRETSSDSEEGNIPTFSFLGSTYTSKYISFTPYEEEDRNQNPLQTVPTAVQDLYTKYDGSGDSGTVFSPGGTGIPFLNIANKYVSAGDPPYLSDYWDDGSGPLENGGPGAVGIAQAIHDPLSSEGKAINASGFIVMANFISAAVCAVDGDQPAAVCNSSGVREATTAFKAVTPIG